MACLPMPQIKPEVFQHDFKDLNGDILQLIINKIDAQKALPIPLTQA
jgi:hypothetical protein